jgi:hypothetical protein
MSMKRALICGFAAATLSLSGGCATLPDEPDQKFEPSTDGKADGSGVSYDDVARAFMLEAPTAFEMTPNGGQYARRSESESGVPWRSQPAGAHVVTFYLSDPGYKAGYEEYSCTFVVAMAADGAVIREASSTWHDGTVNDTYRTSLAWNCSEPSDGGFGGGV